MIGYDAWRFVHSGSETYLLAKSHVGPAGVQVAVHAVYEQVC
jgi:hypothetical protein